MSNFSSSTRSFFCIFFLAITGLVKAQESHPKLILTAHDVSVIRENVGNVPLFDSTLKKAITEVDAEMSYGIDVPTPIHEAGGYTHERHKRNFLFMQKAGVLYQITGKNKYAQYVKDMLFQYAHKYPTWGLHPSKKSYAPGRVFWQALNDANWLVYTSQAYDCIYTFLTESERNDLEQDLFYPFARHISEDSPQFFNRIHNHSTWATAAVGMIGLVMDDEKLIQQALHGLKHKEDSIDETALDNDGGFIRTAGKLGFLANLESPFSPDGYLTEGPYYQRYAMYPFMAFAVSLYNATSDTNLFAYKNGVLVKAVNALLQLSNQKGEFFPINDAQKGMSVYAREIIAAVSNAYYYGNQDTSLLSVAKAQGRVSLDSAGFAVALAISKNEEQPLKKESVVYGDGSTGEEGGLAVIRAKNTELLYKFTSHGLSHGHYDKLSFMYYVNGDEMVQDYGLARFVNIEQKNGGGYLKENSTWAKQTIAHNTLVVDKKTQFNGRYKDASMHHADLLFESINNPKIQVVSAIEKNAYPETIFQRTFFVITDDEFHNPIVVDLLHVMSHKQQLYDLPFYYLGQPMEHNINLISQKQLLPLGMEHGYQHLWRVAEGKSSDKLMRFNWLNKNVFLTRTTLNLSGDSYFLVRSGANDPDLNLRADPGLIQRRSASRTTFISTLEAHGSYSPVSEFAVNSRSQVKDIRAEVTTEKYSVVIIALTSGKEFLLAVANNTKEKSKNHSLTFGDETLSWTGPYYFKSNQ